MKKLFGGTLCVLTLFVLLLSGCTRLSGKPSVFMWEVQAKEGSGKLYLLGSIHAAKDDLYPLNRIIETAYENSNVLAVECDVSTLLQRPNLQEIMKKMMYADGSTLRDHIPSELYEKANAQMKKNGLSLKLYERLKPFALSSILLSSQMVGWGYNPENGIDLYFLNKAHKEGKKIVEIESLEFQYDLLGGFNDDIQTLILKSTLEGTDSSKEYLDRLFIAWLSGDVKVMEAQFMEEDDTLTAEQKKSYAIYEKAMFEDRNTAMTQKAEEYLREGNTTFYIVGSGHMVGETGIVRQLRNKGYKVSQK